jgi:hypothetical protein
MKKIYLIILVSLSAVYSQAQVKIGNNPTSVLTGSLLELEHKPASPKALTLPRMTDAEMNAIPAPTNGMFVYNITGNCVFQYRTNLGWASLCNTVDPAAGAAPSPGSASSNRLWPYHTNDLTIGAVGNAKGIIALPGNGQIASGDYSHAEGNGAQATEPFGWAIMETNYSYGKNAFTLGKGNTNYGEQSFLAGEGNFSDVGTLRTVSFGKGTQFNSTNATDGFSAAGSTNKHFQPNTVSFGSLNTMNQPYSYAFGTNNYTNASFFGFAFGDKNYINNGYACFAGGISDTVVGNYNFAYGAGNRVLGTANGVVGTNHVIGGAYNFATGNDNLTTNFYTVMGGNGHRITADASTAFGSNNRIQSPYSMAAGLQDTLNYTLSYAFGQANRVETIGMAVGQGNKIGSVSLGRPTFAFGGGNITSDAAYSVVIGEGNTIKNGICIVGMGEKNVIDGDRTFVLAGGGFNDIKNSTINSAWPSGTIGAFNKIAAEGAMIFGYNAQLTTRGSIGFADLSVGIANTPFPGAVDNSFNARYAGGYQLFTNAGQTTGAALLAGATAWTSLSDITSKENIRDNSYGLNELMKLGTYSYNYKGNGTEKRNIGVMAQEVKATMPELVQNMNNGKMGVTYTEMIPVLIKAIQEQQAEIEKLKAQIEKK